MIPYRKRKAEKKKKNLTCGACGYATYKPPNCFRHIARKHGPEVCVVKNSDRPGELPQLLSTPPEYFMKYSPYFKKKRQQSGDNSYSGEDSTDKSWNMLETGTKQMELLLRFLKALSSLQQPSSQPFLTPISTTGFSSLFSGTVPSNGVRTAWPTTVPDASGTVVTGLCLALCPGCNGACIAKLHEYDNGDRQQSVLQPFCRHNTQGADATKMLADGVTEWAEGSAVGMNAAAMAQLPEQVRSEVVWIDIADPKFDWLAGALVAGRPLILHDCRHLEQFLSLTRATIAIIGIRAGQAGNSVACYFLVRLRRQKDIRQQQAQ